MDPLLSDNKNVKQCTMAQALKKSGIKDFVKNYYLCFHFLKPELFQMKIFGCFLLCSFTFILYFGYELKTDFRSSKIAKKSVAIQTGCGKNVNQMEGTS